MATEFVHRQVRYGTKEYMQTKLDGLGLLPGSRAAEALKHLRRRDSEWVREHDRMGAAASTAAFCKHNAADVAVRRDLRKFQERAFRYGEFGDSRAQTISENPSDHYLFGGANPHMEPERLISVEYDFTPNRKAWNAYSQRGETYKGRPEENVDNIGAVHAAHPKKK